MKEQFKADVENVRIDVFLSEKLEQLSRSNVQKLAKSELILVNDKKVKSNYKIKLGDVIDVTFEEPKEVDILAENIPLDIVYEDSELLVVNKPEGMVVHPAPGNYTGTLVNALMYHCKDNLSGINGELRPGIVHRIDKETSGILVVAKTNEAHIKLSEQLQNHSMMRKYHAIVHNRVKENEGTVDKPIARDKKDRKKMAINLDGRRAVTHYKVLEKFDNFTYVEFKLETGRTHQIRIHMKSIGHPLLGDETYSKNNHKFNLNGQVLHAKQLGFVHPKTNEYMEFNSELPQSFEKVLNYYRSKND